MVAPVKCTESVEPEVMHAAVALALNCSKSIGVDHQPMTYSKL